MQNPVDGNFYDDDNDNKLTSKWNFTRTVVYMFVTT